MSILHRESAKCQHRLSERSNEARNGNRPATRDALGLGRQGNEAEPADSAGGLPSARGQAGSLHQTASAE